MKRLRWVFKSKLFRYPGPDGETFARIPARRAPPVTDGFGDVHQSLAGVDGISWETSVWNDKTYGILLACSKAPFAVTRAMATWSLWGFCPHARAPIGERAWLGRKLRISVIVNGV